VVSGHLAGGTLKEVGHPTTIACLDRLVGFLKRDFMSLFDFSPDLTNSCYSFIALNSANNAMPREVD
jgi:hypothetical protein